MEELLQGFWGGVIGDMIAVFFVLCHFLGKKQHRQIRDKQITNFSLFAWRYFKRIARELQWYHATQNPSSNSSYEVRILKKMQHRQIRDVKIINVGWFAWIYFRNIAKKLQ